MRKGRKEDGEGKVGRGVVEKGRVINERGCDKGDGRKIMRFSRELDELWNGGGKCRTRKEGIKEG